MVKLFVLDIETVALSDGNYFQKGRFNDMISLAIVELNTGQEYYWSLKPPKEYHDTLNWYQGHGMSWESQKDQPTLPDVWQEIFSTLNNNIVIAHNAFDFDMKAFYQSAKEYELKLPNITWLDTKYQIAKAEPNTNTSLKAQCTKYGFYDGDNHHNALADARMLVKLVKELWRQPKYQWNPEPELSEFWKSKTFV